MISNTKKLVLRVCYEQQTTLKFSVNSDNAFKFLDLKQILVKKLQENSSQHENLKPQQLILCDTSKFIFSDTDLVEDLLQNDELVIATLLQNQLPEIPQKQQSLEQQTDAFKQQQQEQMSNQIVEDPEEAIVVIYDNSGSMASRFSKENGGNEISRIGAVNAFFSAFADKNIAFNLNHIVQLFTFNSTFKKMNEFTEDFESFILLVDGQQPQGGTALYDTMNAAIDSLLEIKQKYPKILPRIIALTDGEDNSSHVKPDQIVERLMKNKIILDSFVVGGDCLKLKDITHQCKGKCYYPQDINQGLKLFEIETILCLKHRDMNYDKLFDNFDPQSVLNQPFDTEGIAMAQPKEAEKPVVQPEDVVKNFQNPDKQVGNNIKRIVKEIEDYIKTPLDLVKIFPSQDNVFYWKALLIGPQVSIYNQGLYLISIQFPQCYPTKPPKITFLTPIYHCNISSQGTSCMEDLLEQNWDPSHTVITILNKLQALLISPNPTNALDSTIASEMRLEPEKYKKNATEHTIKYANKTVEQVLVELMGISVDTTSTQYLEKKQELSTWIATFKKSI